MISTCRLWSQTSRALWAQRYILPGKRAVNRYIAPAGHDARRFNLRGTFRIRAPTLAGAHVRQKSLRAIEYFPSIHQKPEDSMPPTGRGYPRATAA